jgi:hypothetical protein
MGRPAKKPKRLFPQRVPECRGFQQAMFEPMSLEEIVLRAAHQFGEPKVGDRILSPCKVCGGPADAVVTWVPNPEVLEDIGADPSQLVVYLYRVCHPCAAHLAANPQATELLEDDLLAHAASSRLSAHST